MNPVSGQHSIQIESPPLSPKESFEIHETYEYRERVEALETKIFDILKKLPAFQGIEKADVYRLVFMERDRLTDGKFAYENEEPGYLAGALNGYLFMLETLDEELTPELLVKMHDASVAGVSTRDLPGGIPLGYRKYEDGGEAFGLSQFGPLPTLTEKGYRELMDRWEKYCYADKETGDVHYFLQESMENPKYTIGNQSRNPKIKTPFAFNESPCIKLKPTRPQTCRVDIEQFIKFYNAAPKATGLEIKRAIGRLCQDMDQRHTYVDGNIRNAGIFLLNRELLRRKMSPCVMRDVNQLDCLHLDQEIEEEGPGIVQAIEEGQMFFKNLQKRKPELPAFSLSLKI
ncbi:MAG: hypothetical protein K1X28_08405 [Parachlamydiales bacterium]|nr:hypothetical protein [Parachlamydiales bacterium]